MLDALLHCASLAFASADGTQQQARKPARANLSGAFLPLMPACISCRLRPTFDHQ